MCEIKPQRQKLRYAISLDFRNCDCLLVCNPRTSHFVFSLFLYTQIWIKTRFIKFTFIELQNAAGFALYSKCQKAFFGRNELTESYVLSMEGQGLVSYNSTPLIIARSWSEIVGQDTNLIRFLYKSIRYVIVYKSSSIRQDSNITECIFKICFHREPKRSFKSCLMCMFIPMSLKMH